MKMNRQMTIGLVGLICGVALIAGFGGEASALDRRFELDTRALDQKSTPVVPVKRAPAAKSVPNKTTAPIRQTPAGVTSVSRGTAGSETYTEGRLSLLRMTPASGEAAMTTLLTLWDRLVPAAQPVGPLELRADNFSLRLDPKAYQVIPAADGGKIIIDANRNLPPLIRNLIMEKDPTLRIVSETPSSGKRFFSQLLMASGFYSVEPDFTVEFGDDPRLSVRADYRIERTPESLLSNDTVLLYTDSGRYAFPQSLEGFLGNAGFQVIEPDLPHHDAPPHRDRFIQVSAGSRFQVADTVLAALGLETEAGKSIEFTGWVNQGISLMVRVDRAFIYKGKPYALAVFDGNPVTYTLTRLLETQGVTVVVLSQEDDFHAVTGKLLTALKLPAMFDRHRLWPLRETPYTVQMSGYLVRDTTTGRNIFLTDREVTPLLLDLIDRNGYAVTGIQQ
jgi:hypothetical protein